MKEKEIKKLELALELKREVVGVKFVFIKEEYDDCPVTEMEKRNTFCGAVAVAMQGEVLKAKVDCFTCQGGPEMLGMKKVSNYVKSGKQFSTFRLYEDMAVAREVQNDLCFVDQKIYGIIVGPLKKMEDADVAMFVCSAWQGMRVIQGYTYHYGMAKNIGMIGNQGICSDLVARPYMKNDLNISVMCLGARMHTKAEDGELGIGMPIRMLWPVIEGVVNTINPAMEDGRKKELLERIGQEDADKLGIKVEFGKMYGSYGKDLEYPESLYEKELF